MVTALRGLSGLVAGGLVVLAVVVAATGILGAQEGIPGPGAVSLTWHLLAAVVAVAAQSVADRRTGVPAVAAALVVVATAVLLMWSQWWT